MAKQRGASDQTDVKTCTLHRTKGIVSITTLTTASAIDSRRQTRRTAAGHCCIVRQSFDQRPQCC